MSSFRIALIAGGSAFIAAWITAATTVRQPGVIVDVGGENERLVVAPMAGPNPAVLRLAEEVSRLRGRFAKKSVPQETVRNPFTLGPLAPMNVTSVSTLERHTEGQPVHSPGTQQQAPETRLVGLAVDDYGFTAILTLRTGEVLLVGIGDAVTGGYRVKEIDSTGVTLADADGRSQRLVLP